MFKYCFFTCLARKGNRFRRNLTEEYITSYKELARTGEQNECPCVYCFEFHCRHYFLAHIYECKSKKHFKHFHQKKLDKLMIKQLFKRCYPEDEDPWDFQSFHCDYYNYEYENE